LSAASAFGARVRRLSRRGDLRAARIDVLVGALLCKPQTRLFAGVIYFNTRHHRMCGHGTIGLIASLLTRAN